MIALTKNKQTHTHTDKKNGAKKIIINICNNVCDEGKFNVNDMRGGGKFITFFMAKEYII